VTYRPKLFTGIELDDQTRVVCAQIASRLEAAGLRGRFEAPEKLHITVAFLGWVNAEQVEPIRDGLRQAAGELSPFAIALDTIGAFPHERNPHIVWIGSRERNRAFERLAGTLRSAYEPLGFTFQKEAIPHVTVARIKTDKQHLPMLEISPLQLNVRHITLFESMPAGRTTRYEIVHQARLG